MSELRPVLFGEVLFDHFPDGTSVLGGAPFNVAWNLQALGFDPLFVSRVGTDDSGRRVLDAMRAFGMDTQGLQIDEDHPTGAVEVRIEDGEPSYDIVANQAYDHIDASALSGIVGTAILCHGTLALRSAGPRAALERLLAAATRRVVDVNLRAPWWERGRVLASLRGADVAKLNERELSELAGEAADIVTAARGLAERCGLARVVVTRGARGVVAIGVDGSEFSDGPLAVDEVVDTVGAGDAFTAVLVAAECAGWTFETGLRRALELASGVVGLRGATCGDPDFYLPYRNRWGLT